MKREAVLSATAFTAALAAWAVGNLALGGSGDAAGRLAADGTLLTQCLAAVLLAPWLATGSDADNPIGLAPLLLVPWPLLALALALGGAELPAVALGQAWAATCILLAYFIARSMWQRLGPGPWWIPALLVVQLAPALLLWTWREQWIQWLYR